jgi:hypothetical protein
MMEILKTGGFLLVFGFIIFALICLSQYESQ